MKFTAKLLHGSAREKRKAHLNLRFFPFTAEICSQKVDAHATAWPARSQDAIWQMSLSAPGENGFWKAPELWGTWSPEDQTSFSEGNELYTPSSRVCECSHYSAVSLAEPTTKLLVWYLTFQHCHSSWNMTHTCYCIWIFQKATHY